MTSTTAAPTAPASKKLPLDGTLHMKEVVELSPKEDGTPRQMGVLQVFTGDDVVRITDFSKQHEGLVAKQPITLVYEETHQLDSNQRPVTYRNLITAVQE